MRTTRAPVRDRVVHILDDLHVGGAQQLVITFARVAAAREVPVTVLSMKPDDGGRVGSELRALGAEVVQVPRPTGRLGTARQALGLVRQLARLRPAAVQTHLTLANVFGLPAARLAGAVAVGTLHSTEVGADGNAERTLRLETLVLRRVASTVVAVGGVVEAAQRQRLAPHPAVVVPNVTDAGPTVTAAARTLLRAELTGDADVPLVLAVGRLVKAKGYDDLLTAWGLVVAGGSRAVLAIVGTGELREQLERRVRDAGLDGSVRLLGSRDDSRQAMAVADVYVSASLWEGLPLTLLEAMAAGLPIVTTAVGDVPSVVDQSCALLAPPGRPDLVAAHLSRLLADPRLRAELGSAAAQRVQEQFGTGQWFDRLLVVYGLVQPKAPEPTLSGVSRL